jgi:hypothetical protein
MQCLRSFLIQQAGIKACASAPISLLLLSSALRRRPGSHRESICQWFLVAPPAHSGSPPVPWSTVTTLHQHRSEHKHLPVSQFAKTILRYMASTGLGHGGSWIDPHLYVSWAVFQSRLLTTALSHGWCSQARVGPAVGYGETTLVLWSLGAGTG